MENFDYFILARTLYVVGVVICIGGFAFVTTVLIPSLRTITDTRRRLELFEQLEGRFASRTRMVILITGLPGLCMLEYLNSGDRYLQLQFW